MSVASTAAALDDALDALEAAAIAFRDAMDEARQDFAAAQPATFSGYRRVDHAIYDSFTRFFAAAVASHPVTARALGGNAKPPGYKIADNVS
jgi:hypothetical protein